MNLLLFEVLLFVLALVGVLRGRPREIVFAIFASWTADTIASSSLGPSIPFFRMLAIFLLPTTIPYTIRLVRESGAFRWLISYYALLVLLGLVYGGIFPWPDTSGFRPWSQRAEGRVLISLGRQFADLSVLVYLAKHARDRSIFRWVLYGLFAGLGVNLAFAGFDAIVGGRLIYRILPRPHMEWFESIGRLRQGGLNGEPRGLGRVAVVTFLASLALPERRNLRIVGIFLSLSGLVVATSSSALAALLAGLFAYLAVAASRGRGRQLAAGVSVVLVLALTLFVVWGGTVDENVEMRISAVGSQHDREPWEPDWIASLEVFDRSAMRFFYWNPEHLAFGVGPDLISLPGSDHMSKLARVIYGDRIDSTPHMGLIATLANGGILGVLLWLAAYATAARSLIAKAPPVRDAVLSFLVPLFATTLLVASPISLFVFGLAVGRYDRLLPPPERAVREPGQRTGT